MLWSRAADLANEREVLGKKRAPIANFSMDPNSEPPLEQQPSIYRLRQQVGET
jgi:hypothetical protein